VFCIARLITPLTLSRKERRIREKSLLKEPHGTALDRACSARQPLTQLPRVERMASTHCLPPMAVYDMESTRVLCALWQQQLAGASRHLEPPVPPRHDLVPQLRRLEAQSRQKSVRRIRTLILRHARTKDQEQRPGKVATTITTATTVPSAAGRGGVERSNLSSAWGGSFNTPIPTSVVYLVLSAELCVGLKNSMIRLFCTVMWTRVVYPVSEILQSRRRRNSRHSDLDR